MTHFFFYFQKISIKMHGMMVRLPPNTVTSSSPRDTEALLPVCHLLSLSLCGMLQFTEPTCTFTHEIKHAHSLHPVITDFVASPIHTEMRFSQRLPVQSTISHIAWEHSNFKHCSSSFSFTNLTFFFRLLFSIFWSHLYLSNPIFPDRPALSYRGLCRRKL